MAASSTATRLPVVFLRRWGWHLLIAGVSVFLLLLVHRKVYEHFSYSPRYAVDLEAFKADNYPDWLVDEQLKSSVAQSLDYDLKTSIFDDNLIAKVRAHYESSPWVKEVKLIERRLPNNLVIKLDLRRPYVAVNRTNRGVDAYYLVDKDGVRLPGEYRAVPALPLIIPVIIGVKNNPPAAGEPWDDKGLNAALSVVAQLDENSLLEPLQLGQVDVANIGGKRNPRETEIMLWTKGRVRVEWGRAPDTDKFGELAVADKIKNLKTVLETCPGLKGIKYAKIQFDQPYIAVDDK